MSMNFSQHVRVVSALLAVTSGLVTFAVAQGSQQKSSYYQTISIDAVLKTKPAVIYVSPKYQVTIVVNGREITGVSLELSKQKMFSVTLADNHRMIFLDTLTNKGGADLNLILDEEQGLPVHLLVKDVPSGTRIYTFETAQGVEEADQPASAPAAAPAPITPPAPPSGGNPPTAPATNLAPATSAAPSTTPAAAAVRPSAAAAPTTDTDAGRLGTVDTVSTAKVPTAKVSTADLPAAKMQVKVVKSGADATVTLRLSSLNGLAVRADVRDLRLYDGWKAVPYTFETEAKGRLLPVEVTLRVPNVPSTLTVQWPVSNVVTRVQATLKSNIKVN